MQSEAYTGVDTHLHGDFRVNESYKSVYTCATLALQEIPCKWDEHTRVGIVLHRDSMQIGVYIRVSVALHGKSCEARFTRRFHVKLSFQYYH